MCQLGPGLATTSPDTNASFCICQTATVPSVFCHRISELSPLKNAPMPISVQLGPGSGLSRPDAESVAPFACHNANWPLVFCNMTSRPELLAKTDTLLVPGAD